MVPFTNSLSRLRRRRFVGLAVILGLLLQGLMPLTASARAPVAGDAAELLGGKVAICSPYGITYTDIGQDAPAPAQPVHGPCLDCCPCALAALPSSDGIQELATVFAAAVFIAPPGRLPSGRAAFRPQAPRGPPAA